MMKKAMFFLLLIALLWSQQSFCEERTPPILHNYDVVYVVLDAFHAKHSNVYGYAKNTTPFLEKLSHEAVVFENMFANAPHTLASTATLFTSSYPHEHGLITLQDTLNPGLPTLAELLSSAGIDTYLITRHGYLLGEWGLSRGFSNILQERFEFFPEKLIEVLQAVYRSPGLKRKFVYIHISVPHIPYQPPEQFRTFVREQTEAFPDLMTNDSFRGIDTGEIAISAQQLAYIIAWYDSNLLYADSIVQSIVTELQEQGVLEKSVLVIASDHGEAFLQHGRMQHGSTLFDEMLYVPFLIRFPKESGIIPKRISSLASLVDVVPTLMELYGIKQNTEYSGTSLFPSILFGRPVNNFLYAEGQLDGIPMKAIRDREYKYIRSPQQEMLFSLVQDPGERQNIIHDRPRLAEYYQRLIVNTVDREEAFPAKRVETRKLPDALLQNLRELGYIE